MLELTEIRRVIGEIKNSITIDLQEDKIIYQIWYLEELIEELKYSGLSIFNDKKALKEIDELIKLSENKDIYYYTKNLRA